MSCARCHRIRRVIGLAPVKGARNDDWLSPSGRAIRLTASLLVCVLGLLMAWIGAQGLMAGGLR
jgi:hypothetical protein